MMTLSRELRRLLENTVREARHVAETGARKVLEQLAIHHHEPWTSMTPEQRELRNALRAHGRQLGDRRDERRGVQAIERLTTECAYEHWHRMLFARFLAESNLLIEPESSMDITLEDCQELARERGGDWLELASAFAERMLPEIFRTSDPVLKLALPPETRSKLETVLKALPRDIFVADDSLGWVYQYWQADRKDEVNKSEKKVGADELPAVTQLFTEDYMVLFLLHNTLGAWWAGKVLAAKPELARLAKNEDELRAACAIDGIEWAYLRFVRDGDQPWGLAAGTFNGWPKTAKEITLLDPCMGSGHFLLFALPILVAFRGAEEGLTREDAIDSVLRDNLFGLEIDPRCTQIAAFNLALAAWRTVGHRPLPRLHLACSGLSLGVNKVEWGKLAERAAASSSVPPERDLLGTKDNLFSARIKTGLERLYDVFVQAPVLGSLINPRSVRGDMFAAEFAQLEPMLGEILDTTKTDELAEMAVAAQGMAKAAELLAKQFTLVATNVPYLGREMQVENLRDFCDEFYPLAKADLATVFVQRVLELCSSQSTVALVVPQYWLFLGRSKHLRAHLLSKSYWRLLAKLGPGAFESISGEVVNVALTVIDNLTPIEAKFNQLDVSKSSPANAKAQRLKVVYPVSFDQKSQLSNPDSVIGYSVDGGSKLLEEYATSYQGLATSDNAQFVAYFWEQPTIYNGWELFQMAPEKTTDYGGCSYILLWEGGTGRYYRHAMALKTEGRLGGWKSGSDAWGTGGVAVNRMSSLPVALYPGVKFDCNVAVVIPKNPKYLAAIYSFCASDEYAPTVRKLNQKVSVTNATLAKVPFDLSHWLKVADKQFPTGAPAPESNDPTQWLFNGHPKSATNPLQVAIARLVGFRWPRQTGTSLPGCPAVGPDGLEQHEDANGIVSFRPLRGEASAADRLVAILSKSYGSDWSSAKLTSLLASVGVNGGKIEDWLQEEFFTQHCELFFDRPFIWHVWDGRRDGFHALVNYHKLVGQKGEGKRTLETLIYTYLGDWIDRQRADQKADVEGADGRLAAAEHLRGELEKILAGEPPYDLFVRWKPLSEQPIGWAPEIDDGVKVNIRPFITAKPLNARAKGACILRVTPKIKWDKDRGKEAQRSREEFPWYWSWDENTEDFEGTKTFDGHRWSDLHYSCGFKKAVRARSKK